VTAGVALLVGLGNPGPDYARTRHNAGFWFVDRLAESSRGSFRREAKFHGEVCRLSLQGADLWLLKPATYMNLSGDAVSALTRFYRIEPTQIVVAHDELDLEPGTVRLKLGGGGGGHNGLGDIIEKLCSRDFYRLRIGIGHPGTRELVTPFVLGRPSMGEEDQIISAIDQAIAVIPLVLAGQINKAMTQLNRRPPAEKASTVE
jgi:peptidyl-tRNA hydrolase, PTH1 family